MTYNFDPDRWFERQKMALEVKHQEGNLSDEEFATEISDLERRHEEMLDRLDGTYDIRSRNEYDTRRS